MENKKNITLEYMKLVVLVACIAGLVFAVTVLVKNKELIMEKPLEELMGDNGFKMCTCTTPQGQSIVSTKEGLWDKQKYTTS